MLVATDPKTPYGNVAYADPGYQSDGKKRYPVDTEAHVRSAWSYINQSGNQSAYSSDQVSKIKARIVSAGKKLGVKFSEADSQEWAGKTIKEAALGVALEDELSADDADLLLGRLVNHVTGFDEAASSAQDHTHSGQPQQIADHLSSSKHGLSSSSHPGTPAGMHAVHQALHGGDISKSPKAEPEKAKESQPAGDFIGDVVPLKERAVGEDGTVRVKLIAPGWGTSGFYGPEVLKKDGPKAFPKGTFMNWDHPTISEERERPEGSLDKLASVITSTPEYLDDGPDGPGLYANAKAFSAYKEAIDELAPHIGLSIRADGKVSEGQRDGKRGRIVEEISRGRSVDWVTLPGAGGKATQLFEAFGRGGNVGDEKTTKTTKTPEEIAAEAKAEEERKAAEAKSEEGKPASQQESKRTEGEQRLLEKLAVRDARDVVTEILATKSNVPEPTAKRLKESLPTRITLTDDGELDTAAFRTLAEKAIDDEITYVAEASGVGRVRGMGDGGTADPKEAERLKETRENVQKNLVALGGVTEKQAELAMSDG